MTNQIVEAALKKGQRALSEYESKKLLAAYGVPITRESLVQNEDEAVTAAVEIGFPVVVKACSPDATHKTEMKLIELNLKGEGEVRDAYRKLKDRASGIVLEGMLVQEMVSGDRELVVGMMRDPQFGPCIMFGLGGIYTEALKDVSFRVAPIDEREAEEMAREIRGNAVLGPYRGKPPVDMKVLAKALIGVGQVGLDLPNVKEIDVNPLIVSVDGTPVAVDALVIISE